MSTPFDHIVFCRICGNEYGSERCVCPTCQHCLEVGEPKCYSEHGMIITDLQEKEFNKNRSYWVSKMKEEDARAQALEEVMNNS